MKPVTTGTATTVTTSYATTTRATTSSTTRTPALYDQQPQVKFLFQWYNPSKFRIRTSLKITSQKIIGSRSIKRFILALCFPVRMRNIEGIVDYQYLIHYHNLLHESITYFQ